MIDTEDSHPIGNTVQLKAYDFPGDRPMSFPSLKTLKDKNLCHGAGNLNK